MDSYALEEYEYFIFEEDKHNCICGYDKEKKILIEFKDKVSVNKPVALIRVSGFTDDITVFNWKNFIINYLKEKI